MSQNCCVEVLSISKNVVFSLPPFFFKFSFPESVLLQEKWELVLEQDSSHSPSIFPWRKAWKRTGQVAKVVFSSFPPVLLVSCLAITRSSCDGRGEHEMKSTAGCDKWGLKDSGLANVEHTQRAPFMREEQEASTCQERKAGSCSGRGGEKHGPAARTSCHDHLIFKWNSTGECTAGLTRHSVTLKSMQLCQQKMSGLEENKDEKTSEELRGVWAKTWNGDCLKSSFLGL